MLADNGQTIVLGGLITDDRQQIKSQVPVLGDIPVARRAVQVAPREPRRSARCSSSSSPRSSATATTPQAITDAKYGRLRGDEATLRKSGSLLLNPPGPRLTLEIEGIY